jgi:hypothetical protein
VARLDPTVAERFETLVGAFAGIPGVELPMPPGAGSRGFGSSALRVDGRIFAMVSRGRLVLKMPAAMVTALIADGTGGPFDAGKGRPMREWISLEPGTESRWLDLATQALEYVRTTG